MRKKTDKHADINDNPTKLASPIEFLALFVRLMNVLSDKRKYTAAMPIAKK